LVELPLPDWVFEAEPVAVGVQLQRMSSGSSALTELLPLTTVTSPEAAPLATACSHLTALFFREGEETTAEDLLGLRLPASSCIRVKGLPVLVTDEGLA